MPPPPPREPGAARLPRVVGLPGAVLLGLGSILGTGVFVSLGIAAGVAGPGILLAVPLAALVAVFNGLSSAQLAASHPVSGGTYEYGYRWLSPTLGFLAGWTFLAAKSASAATAALGLAGYALTAVDRSGEGARAAVGVAVVVAVTALVAGGMHRSNRANAVVVALTLAGLGAFVLGGLPLLAGGSAEAPGWEALTGLGDVAARDLLHATALLFVAYTGYGRIATLGEEVRDPARVIPAAVVTTLTLTMLLYMGVTVVAVGTAGADGLARATAEGAAPLETLARAYPWAGVAWLVGVAAVSAMAGVLLNLVLGLSRVALAMGRRGDLPRGLAAVSATHGSPARAVWGVGLLVALLAAFGNVRTTWSFSAFTVLVYYALTNLAALRLPPEARRYPRWIPAAGLVTCVGLAFWVEPAVWGAGLALLAVGLAWRAVARRAGGGAPR